LILATLIGLVSIAAPHDCTMHFYLTNESIDIFVMSGSLLFIAP